MIDAVGAIYVRRVAADRWYVVVETDGDSVETGPYLSREHATERLDTILSESIAHLLDSGLPVERVDKPGGGYTLRVKRGLA